MDFLKFLVFLFYLHFFYQGYCSDKILEAKKHSRILTGQNATLGQFPYAVYISIMENIHTGQACTGNILNKDTVLTAAHCLLFENVSQQADAKLITVYAGGVNLKDMKKFQVSRIRVHEDNVIPDHIFDIAIIKIKGRFWEDKPTFLIQPIEIANKRVPDNTKCQIAGWGWTKLNNPSSYLKYATMYTLASEQCQIKKYIALNYTEIDLFTITRSFVSPDGYLCITSSKDNPASSCQGDSGGPLVCPVNGKNMLTGITSFGFVKNCNSYDFPNVYTDVLYYREWIEYAMNNDDGYVYDNDSETKPYIVYLNYNNTIECEGCILNKDTVITTANCLIQHGELKDASKINVLMDKDKSKKFTVKSIEIHKDFNEHTRENNIGFLKMIDAFWEDKPTWQIRAIELVDERVPANTICQYHDIWTKLLSNEECDYNFWYKYYDGLAIERENVFRTTDRMLCGFPDDPCKYYVGGPLVCKSKGKYRLVGIKSFGKDHKDPCVEKKTVYTYSNNPTVFVDVMYYQQWIKNLTYGNYSSITSSPTGIADPKSLSITNDSIPYVVLVTYLDHTGKYKRLCTGSIISPRKVLIAAHCLMDPNPKREFDNMFDRSRIFIWAGNMLEEHMKKTFRVTRMERHEDCDLSSSPPLNDIAYIEVDVNFWDIKYPKPFVHAIELINEKIPDNITCQIVRYGQIECQEFRFGLQYAPVKIVNKNECNSKYQQQIKKHGNITNLMMCVLETKALYKEIIGEKMPNIGALDICKINSGSPLICSIKNKHRLVGIGSKISENCQDDNYKTYFSNVMYYNKWIQYVVHHKRPSIFTNASEPYLVLVYRDDVKSPPQACGGSIIDNELILTAARCITNPDSKHSTYDIVHRSYITVYTYSMHNDTKETKSRRMLEYNVKDMFRHANYDPSSNPALNDIAIIKVEKAVKDNVVEENDSRILLTKFEVLGDKGCQIVNWGEIINKEGNVSILQFKSSVKVLNYDECARTYGKKINKTAEKDDFIYSQHLCAIGTDNNYKCKDYLGGALVCPTHEGKYALVGIISSAFDKCEKVDYPVVISSVMYYQNWLYYVTKNDAPLFFTNGSAPYMVLIYRDNGKNPQIFCTGSIIDYNTVLSSSSCLIDNRTADYLQNSVYAVNKYKVGMVKYDIKLINFHNNYNSLHNPPLNDIAIIQINGEFEMSPMIALANETVSSEEECEIFRWGIIDHRDLSIPQYTSSVKILYSDKCAEYGKEINCKNGNIISGMICVVATNANYKCEDYTGGSLVCPIKGTKRLVGVSSFGIGNCEKNPYPSIFSDVRYYQQWITDSTASITGPITTPIIDPNKIPSTGLVTRPTIKPPNIVKSTEMSFMVLVINTVHHPHLVCGGAIVAQDTVITAAHCLMNVSDKNSNRSGYNLVNVKNIRVMAGDEKEDIYLVKRMDYHKGYNASTNPPLNNIAYIIIVDTFWRLSENTIFMKSIKLINEDVLENTECQVFSYALERYHKNVEIKLKPASIMDDNRCIKEFQKFSELGVQIIKDNVICVKRSLSSRLCNYPGAPLVCQINGTNRLVGIASYNRNVCRKLESFDTPVIFSDVNYYRPWIQDIIVEKDEQYTHTVLVKIKNKNNNNIKICAGSVVKSFKILTAAHCFMFDGLYDHFKYDITVLAGDVREWKMQEFHVRKVKPHDNYDSTNRLSQSSNDIAYVEIHRTRWNENLWQPHIKNIKIKDSVKIKQCQIMGWGLTKIQDGESMHELKFSSVKLIDREECSAILGINISESTICVVRDVKDNINACEDYSSGPLVCKIEDEMILVGMSSSEFSNCRRASVKPTVITNVPYHKEWINKMIADPIAVSVDIDDSITTVVTPQTTSSKPPTITLLFMGFFTVLVSVGILAIIEWIVHLLNHK